MIIGAMKCGTSSLYSYLKGHPEICPARLKEPEFFSQHQAHGMQVNDYASLWSFDSTVHKYALEASTGYTKFPLESDVPAKIFNYGIQPKFIYLIRNPFDRISSHYNFMKDQKSWHLDIVDTHLINISNYFLQLEQYRKYFPLENILIVDFDDLRSVPDIVLGRIYDFLGISRDYLPQEYTIKNATRTTPKWQKTLEKSKLGSIMRYVPKPLRVVGQRIVKSAFPSEKRKLTAEEKDFVFHRLKEDMAKLHHIYGVDVQKWGFDSNT